MSTPDDDDDDDDDLPTVIARYVLTCEDCGIPHTHAYWQEPGGSRLALVAPVPADARAQEDMHRAWLHQHAGHTLRVVRARAG